MGHHRTPLARRHAGSPLISVLPFPVHFTLARDSAERGLVPALLPPPRPAEGAAVMCPISPENAVASAFVLTRRSAGHAAILVPRSLGGPAVSFVRPGAAPPWTSTSPRGCSLVIPSELLTGLKAVCGAPAVSAGFLLRLGRSRAGSLGIWGVGHRRGRLGLHGGARLDPDRGGRRRGQSRCGRHGLGRPLVPRRNGIGPPSRGSSAQRCPTLHLTPFL